MDSGEATRLLQLASEGDRGAAEQLLPLLYEELRAVAQRAMRGERENHTLQPTALVHEAYMRVLPAGAGETFEGRGHFVRLAARAMRNVLVDHARARKAEKRGAGQAPMPLDAALAYFEERDIDVIAMHDVLDKLGAVDEPLARLVELRFFAGLTLAETANALGTSTATVERQWRVARMWLRRELG